MSNSGGLVQHPPRLAGAGTAGVAPSTSAQCAQRRLDRLLERGACGSAPTKARKLVVEPKRLVPEANHLQRPVPHIARRHRTSEPASSARTPHARSGLAAKGSSRSNRPYPNQIQCRIHLFGLLATTPPSLLTNQTRQKVVKSPSRPTTFMAKGLKLPHFLGLPPPPRLKTPLAFALRRALRRSFNQGVCYEARLPRAQSLLSIQRCIHQASHGNPAKILNAEEAHRLS